MKKVIIRLFLAMSSLLVMTTKASAIILPVGTLTVEKRIVNNIDSIFFIARNKSGMPDFQTTPIVFTGAFFLYDYARGPFDGFQEPAHGPDGVFYDGFDASASEWLFEIHSGEQLVVNLSENDFNFNDPLFAKVGFKADEIKLAVLEGPFQYGDEVFLYSSAIKLPNAPKSPTSPTTPNAPKSPKSPKAPNSPNSLFAPTAPDSPFAPNAPFYLAQIGDSNVPTTVNPEPATLLLFGTGIAGAMIRRRKQV